MASVRAAGWTPWLLLGGWIWIAAVQEPTLLRAYRVHLLLQATWVAAIVTAGVLVSNLAASRRTIPYLTSLHILTTLSAAVCVVAFAIAELSYGRPVAPTFGHFVPMVVTLFPAAASLGVAVSARKPVAWLALFAVLALLMTQLPELGIEPWGWRSLAASAAASLSVVALTHAHCQRRA